MKKYKFSIPKNIPHASGIFLAKYLFKFAGFLMLSVFIVCVVFQPDNDKLFWHLIYFSFVLLPGAFLYGYFSGSQRLTDICTYLNSLKKKGNKQIKLLGFEMNKIDQEVEQKISEIRRKIKMFFTPTINSYLSIETCCNEEQWDKLRSAKIKFDEKILTIEEPRLKLIANDLEIKLTDIVFNAIIDKKQVYFSTDKWILSVNIDNERKKIREDLSSNLLAKKIELKNRIEKIENLINDYSQKTVN